MRQPASHTSPVRMPFRSGFTMIELLVTVGIIVLLGALSLVGILAAKKHANDTRVRDDLRLIELALEAYKGDSNGQYPVFADAATDYNSLNPFPIKGNGIWLDYQSCRGAVLLCRALIGPGGAGNNYNSSNTPANPANPGDDGADGPGFRLRRNVSGPTQFGKVYGAYLDASKFKLSYLTPPGQYITFPMAYPVILDSNGYPILYYPAAPGVTNFSSQTSGIAFYNDPNTYTVGNPFPTTVYNTFDNANFLSQASFETMMGDTNQNGYIDTNTTPPEQPTAIQPYLLWTAGTDGVFGLVNGKSDDITNFDLPANLRK